MSEQLLTLDLLADWLRRYAAIVDEHKTYLTELDSAIGDADHGANMARGTAAVLTHVDDATTIDALLKKAGMTLVSTVGGTSGPLYGTLLMKMGMATGSVVELSAEDFGKALRAGLEGLVARGKTELGDKTMVDALAPALDAYDAALADGSDLHDAVAAAAQAAAAGRDATTPMVAKKGRASYLGERSAGHQDPGATSSTYLFDALADVIGA
ncbi:dihydroxyacetone kinase subunit L [Tessaracoccus lapidicaptus]|uniref:Dihydroxyacetone kinase subunit L n=1 Tax=Tessaracoccus lapidicaptus TaxID=1427523 RepID=A0A1C0AHJ2_9ACTN|nr:MULTISPECIES: dihydroxyacetone kinase subunit DhaL [Tessaracoccus]AQX16415.1 dihydroxyacetone kinase subunit L [Tessaracoccus sp. T2.5-30]OCL31480.1 dihydroxyacetone kinase subunit L [Tessaracoccus lapidicaptus]